MSGEIEALGDAVHGGLLATAVDGGAPISHADGQMAHSGCPNCAAPLTGSFCASCGQSAHLHRSLAGFGHDLLHGVLHFEGRIWHTLPLLAWRPGDLTRRYIHGERAKFVTPLALFLFAVFLLYAVAEYTVGEPHFGARVADPLVTLTQQESQLAQQQAIRGAAMGRPALSVSERLELVQAQTDSARAITAIARARATLQSAANADGEYPWAQRTESLLIGDQRVSQPLVRSILAAIDKARENPDLLLYKVKSSAYKYAWALIPLSLPFVWLAMLGRGMRQRHLYDYAVFTTYSIAFMLLLLAAVLVITTAVPSAGWVAFAAFAYAPFHLYRQVRHTWQLGRFSALVRTSVMLFSGIIVLVTFLTTLIAMGVGG